MRLFNFNLKIFLFFFLLTFKTFSQTVEIIEVKGNDRISNDTIKLFSNIEIGDDIDNEDINKILKDLYETSFFDDINITFENKVLTISLIENPIIQKIIYEGIKSNKILEKIKKDNLLREKSSYNEFTLVNEKNRISNVIKDLGFYNSTIQTSIEKLNNNSVSINFNFNLGERAKIKKITLIGDKK